MKQIIHSFSTGLTEIIEVPVPKVEENSLLVKSRISLLSSGTEKMLVDFGKANYFEKARQQPDKLREVIDKSLTDGILATAEAVKSKLDTPLGLGYSNVGTVLKVGKSVKGFKVGDRVVSNGPHAEVFNVSKNLCAKVPLSLSDEDAVFTVVSSIGLQGIRLANPTLGETFLVSGLGLIGLLTSQLLKGNGCRVLGIDIDQEKCQLAESLGIETFLLKNDSNPVDWCLSKTSGIGVDGVLITASTSSSEPIDIAAKSCRKKGRIISVGVTGLSLKRDLFYKKELSFQISCSYGPGRYDDSYENNGIDYPLPYVRWTEKRNFEAVLNFMDSGIIKTKPLITKIFKFEDAPEGYELLTSKEKNLGILFKYSEEIGLQDTIHNDENLGKRINYKPNDPMVSFIGTGNYASRKLIPAFKSAGADFYYVAAPKGLIPSFIGKKFNFEYVTTNVDKIMEDPSCNTVVIATRHDSHADLIKRSLIKRKNIFVEKPLCINFDQLIEIEETYKKIQNQSVSENSKMPILMVGFNRRFAPLVTLLKDKLRNIQSPKAFIFNCNSGYIQPNHWINNVEIGGGRMIGEACHFVDLLRFLADVSITDLKVNFLNDNYNLKDTFSLNISFKDGSIGVINYFSNGSSKFPKERLEVFADRKIFKLENFLKLKTWGLKRNINKRTLYQDKGQSNCVKNFLKSIKSGSISPIPISEIFEVQRFLLNAIKND